MNILLTSAGRRAYIVDYFKAASGIGKVYASNSDYTIALKRADGFFISPLIYSDEYIPAIIGFCRQHNVKAVLSLFDIDLYVLAKHAQEFKDAGIELVLAPEEYIRICNDKYATYKFLLSLNLKTPKTYLSIEETKAAIARGEVSYPILIKPRWGMASMGIYKVWDDEELEFFSRKSYKDIFNSYLKYESSLTEDAPIIYQEVMTCEEYGLDVLNDLNGNYIKTFAKQKVTMRSGETDLGRTADPAPFEATAKALAEAGKHHGICSVDCFKDSHDNVYVTEMNCRISGHYPLAYLAGFNFPQLLVDWMNGKGTNPDLIRFRTELFIVKDLTPTILREGDNSVVK